MRLQQAGGAVKHFINTGVGYPSPNTVLTLYGGTDYDLANSPIIEPYFSAAKAPFGFPLNEAKWRVESLGTADSSQASPVAGTWYNKGGSLVIPAGRWRVEYAAELEVTRGSAGALDVFATLSTAANSEVNKEANTKIEISSGISMRGSVGLCGCVMDLAAKGTYYLNRKTGQASISAIAFKGSEQKTRIRAVCVFVIVVLARGQGSGLRTIGGDKSLKVILIKYKISLSSMPNECRLYTPYQSRHSLQKTHPLISIS